MVDDSKAAEILGKDEGFRSQVYDDATGLPIGPGSYVRGHPTVGIGIALDTGGITREEAVMLTANRLGPIRAALQAYPWFVGLDIVRQHYIIMMAYQMGVRGVLSFTSMIRCLAGHDYVGAANYMLNSKWASQTPKRAARAAEAIRSGAYQVVP